ncbi:MAG TPA: PAS domain-containing protein, partial [Ramlibacter sp.]|nr:PAS domain-containing protein [Ramlibacter sp.]
MTVPATPPHETTTGLSSGGAMAARTRDFPWHTTPLGPESGWPQSLRSTVATLLECQLPMYLAWGPQLTQFYNDAYAPILGAKHPGALGQSTPETWPEIWPTIGPMWQEVLAGKAIGFDDFKLTIERFGYPEDCYFNFSYSPVRDESGQVMGVLVTFAETTQRVLSERRLRFLDELSQRTRLLSDPSEIMQATAGMLGEYLGANRCAYAHVHADEDTFDLIGDYNRDVPSIVGRYRFTEFGAEVQRLMLLGEPYVNDNVDTHPATAGTDLSAYRATRIQAVI